MIKGEKTMMNSANVQEMNDLIPEDTYKLLQFTTHGKNERNTFEEMEI